MAGYFGNSWVGFYHWSERTTHPGLIFTIPDRLSFRLILMRTMSRYLLLSLAFLGWTVASARSAENPLSPAERHFEQNIRPLFAMKCVKCHGEKKQEGNLRLDSRESILKGGDSGPAIVPGKPEESLLIEAIKYESFEMPPTGQLSAKEIEHFERWIGEDALWPKHIGRIREGAIEITESDKDWWAFQPVQKPEIPKHPADRWSKNPIDHFVFDQLNQKGMKPAPEADRLALVRRLYFDLIGMPPTPEEVDAFLRDGSPKAWENLVDQLLDDPRYGEHWARHWLDLVRYAESDGWNQDAYRPHIWRYRDYVIRSFNEDKPYPQFVREQLAGDEMPGDDPQRLAAAGYLRLTIYEYNQRDARSHWDDILNEITDTTSDVFLGMGMACARCHDHKFDPLLQKDYFKLKAFFEPLVWRDDLQYATIAEINEFQKQNAVWEEKTADIRAKIDAFLKPYNDKKWKSTADKFPLDIQAAFYKPVEERTSWEHQMAYLVARQFEEEGGGPLKDMKKEDKEKYEALQKELAAFDDIKPKPVPMVMTVTDFPGQISPTVIPDAPESAVIEPGFLSVLGNESPQISVGSNTTGRRTALAEWIGRPDNPLTTRVIVNRIWQYHFGQGIVPTSSDFGHLGLKPTHPELLDWLTTQFVEEGWSMKKFHRLILTSATWKQSAHHPQANLYQKKDPGEELLWRFRIRRLDAEQIRDAILLASGELQTEVGGPSVESKTPRRAIYVKTFRNNLDPFLGAFDMANGLKSVSERTNTTTPTQSLLMMNGSYPLDQAKKFADRLKKRNHSTPADLLEHAFQIAWNRQPTAEELESARQFVYGTDDKINGDKLADFCHVLFNSNQFLYVD